MKYTEHEKLEKISGESQIIGEFLEWLTGPTQIVLAKYTEKYDLLSRAEDCQIEKLLAEYFGIDLDRIENEKRQMLEEMRRANP